MVLASWAPHIYGVPEGIDVVEVVTAAIRAAEAAARNYYDVQATVKQQFGLNEISVEEFDRYWERSME